MDITADSAIDGSKSVNWKKLGGLECKLERLNLMSINIRGEDKE